MGTSRKWIHKPEVLIFWATKRAVRCHPFHLFCLLRRPWWCRSSAWVGVKPTWTILPIDMKQFKCRAAQGFPHFAFNSKLSWWLLWGKSPDRGCYHFSLKRASVLMSQGGRADKGASTIPREPLSATNDPSTVSKKPTKILLPPKANDQTKQKLDFGEEDGYPSVSQAEQVQVNRVKS